MPRKWDDAEKLVLLTTALACSPGFKMDAKKVVDNWPTSNEEKPSERSVRETFNKMMHHAKDVQTINECRRPSTGNAGGIKKDEIIVKLESVVQRSGGSRSSGNTRNKNKHLPGTPKTPSRKRKREMEEDEMTSGSETGSEKSASDMKPRLKKTPKRKVRSHPPNYTNSDSEAGNLRRMIDSDDSDGEYHQDKE